jgi:acetamidase/formamidase
MKRISREDANRFLFDHRDEPVLRVSPGEKFVIETEDALCGEIRSPDVLPTVENRPSWRRTPPEVNPMGGPVYVEGVEAGDVLAVSIHEIICDSQGVTAVEPGSGWLGDSKAWPTVSEPTTRIIRHLPGPSGTTKDGVARFSDSISWPLAPFIGTIGVAPEREVESSAVGQGPWGGNLDCWDIRPGTKVLINCYHEGGLLYCGDVHASQGDGELTGTANETRAAVTLSCEVIKGKRLPFLRLEKQESLVALYCFRPLEGAMEMAATNLLQWLVEDYGMEAKEMYMLFSVCPDFKVNVYQAVRIGRLNYTVGAELPRRYLPRQGKR